MGRNSTPLVCFAETTILYHEMIQLIEMFETTDRFVKQTPHTLYVTLEKLNDWSVHFAEKAEKAVRFPRQLFTCGLSWLPFAATEWISITVQNGVATKRRQTLQTSFGLTLVKNFMRLLEAYQRAKKVMSDSPGLVDFAIGLVNSVVNLPDRQVRFFEQFE